MFSFELILLKQGVQAGKSMGVNPLGGLKDKNEPIEQDCRRKTWSGFTGKSPALGLGNDQGLNDSQEIEFAGEDYPRRRAIRGKDWKTLLDLIW
jgi:hypothetical protein